MATNNQHSILRSLLSRVYGGDIDEQWFVREGMHINELSRLHELVVSRQAISVLEIGMAMGTSSITLLNALSEHDGSLVSIDPYQSATSPMGFDSSGINNVKKAGFSSRHSLIEKPSYIALPELLADDCLFDVVFIDGWHSFDFTMLDFFYADLVVKDGGVVIFHDSDWPSVFRVTRFLETHKPYKLLSPPPHESARSFASRAFNRMRRTLDGTRKQRRAKWGSLVAYQKLHYEIADQHSVSPF